jgi:hypothetical protein
LIMSGAGMVMVMMDHTVVDVLCAAICCVRCYCIALSSTSKVHI